MLVVEDDDSARNALRLILAHRGWNVAVAASLSEGLASLKNSPDIVLLDLMLPDGDGAELLRIAGRDYPSTRVGVITGVADPERLRGVRQLNPAFVCIKPINVGELLRQMQ